MYIEILSVNLILKHSSFVLIQWSCYLDYISSKMEIRPYNIFLEIQFKTYRNASHQILIQFLDIKRIYDSFKFKICKIIVNIFITKIQHFSKSFFEPRERNSRLNMKYLNRSVDKNIFQM